MQMHLMMLKEMKKQEEKRKEKDKMTEQQTKYLSLLKIDVLWFL